MANYEHTFRRQLPPQTYALVSFPARHLMLVVFNRPRALNAMTSDAQYELQALFAWYDGEPSLRCAVVTGAGRAFCAGMDLREWNQINARRRAGEHEARAMDPPSGFGALSRRHGKKPVVAAVNGLAFGGGLEMLANLDMLVAARGARFALPEVKIGVVPNAGSLPRLLSTIGRPRVTELALTGRAAAADEVMGWGVLNAVVDDAPEDCPVLERPVVQKAMEYAAMIIGNSPDSVIIARAGILGGWESGSVENASRLLRENWDSALDNCENHHEGVASFVEKRPPRWVDSKL